ncbi:DNA methylase [Mycobacterium phage Che9d]|uniref:DNA methylase n=1 Tax=Mycobacterium phage Che9d TaxID=2907834 RepID=Q855N7_9CAUD|nr:DNA methylase [Mycobacterium phage Che9d]AAN07994.1 DNA methylase [Mycobacterium phage Che9d]
MTPYYTDDRVTLYHGDCLEITEWLAADVLVTDPPYGRDWKQGELKGHFTANRSGIQNDSSTDTRDYALQLWGDRQAIVFGDLMLAPPIGTKHVLVYRKPSNAGLRGAVGGYRRDAEAVYLIGPGHGSGIGGESSVIATSAAMMGGSTGLGGRTGHPHEKPLDVLERLLDSTSGVVADPFAGSGSTLVAARNLGRRAIGVELEERYCEIIARRLDQMCLDFGTGA